MKKFLLLMVGAFMLSTSLWAKLLVPLSVNIDDDDMPIGNGIPRSPIMPPTVYLEDGVLTFTAGHPDYTLTIKDEDGDVVYSTIVTSAQTTVVLPSTLTGDYVIELVMGNWLFTGYIVL